jgi:hypothetical protein
MPPPGRTGEKETEAMSDANATETGQNQENVEEPEATEEVVTETAAEGTEESTQEPEIPEHIAKRLDGMQSALGEERKARQAAEQHLAYLSGQVDSRGGSVQPQAQQPIVTEEQFWQDPVAGAAKIAQVSVQTALTRAEAARIDRSSARMRSKHEDYAMIEQQFLQATQLHPGLRDEALMADNPAEFVYEWGKAQGAKNSLEEANKRIAELEARLSGKKPGAPPTTQAGKVAAGATAAGADEPDPFAKPY